MTNPFDLSGPEFLIFYGLLGAVRSGLLWFARRIPRRTAPRIDYSDPYLLAYLRGGEKEVIRVAAGIAHRPRLSASEDDHLSPPMTKQ